MGSSAVAALRPVERSRLYEDVGQRLGELVRESKMAPGDQFPPERELSRRLQVSRTSVRQSFVVLQALGGPLQGGGDAAQVRRVAGPCQLGDFAGAQVADGQLLDAAGPDHRAQALDRDLVKPHSKIVRAAWGPTQLVNWPAHGVRGSMVHPPARDRACFRARTVPGTAPAAWPVRPCRRKDSAIVRPTEPAQTANSRRSSPAA